MEGQTCPVCGKPRIKNRSYVTLKTCGSSECVLVLQRENGRTGGAKRQTEAWKAALSLRMRGNTHKRDATGDNLGYSGLHQRVREILAGQPCAFAGEECKGPIESALSKDTPVERLLGSTAGSSYRLLYSLEPSDYFPLCKRHHNQYDRIQEKRRERKLNGRV